MNPIQIVKAHPLLSTVLIVAVVGVVIIASSGGDVEYIEGTMSDQSGAVALAQYQSQQQGQALAISAQRDIALSEHAAGKYVADLSAQTRLAEIAAGLDLGKYTTEKNTEAQNLANTLAAKIAGDQYTAQAAQQAAQYATLQAQIKSQGDIAMASINANVQVAKINKPKRGLFSKIFG